MADIIIFSLYFVSVKKNEENLWLKVRFSIVIKDYLFFSENLLFPISIFDFFLKVCPASFFFFFFCVKVSKK